MVQAVNNTTMPAALNALNWAVVQWNKDNQIDEWEGELKKLAIQIVVEPEGEQGEAPEYFQFFVYRIPSSEDDEDLLIAKGEMAMALLKDIDKLQSSLADDDEDDEDDENDEDDDEEEEDD